MVDEHHPHLVSKPGVWQRPTTLGEIPAAGARAFGTVAFGAFGFCD